MNHFKDMGYFSVPNFSEITIWADKVSGKDNKNMNIWCILWIAETVLYSCVTLLFFAWGHTKKTEDHILNWLKGGYHKIEIIKHE